MGLEEAEFARLLTTLYEVYGEIPRPVGEALNRYRKQSESRLVKTTEQTAVLDWWPEGDGNPTSQEPGQGVKGKSPVEARFSQPRVGGRLTRNDKRDIINLRNQGLASARIVQRLEGRVSLWQVQQAINEHKGRP